MAQRISTWVGSVRPLLFATVCLEVCALAACGGGAPGTMTTKSVPAPLSAAAPTTAPTSTAVPTAGPTSASITANGDFLGCPYPSGNVWQTNIASAPLATNSAQMIEATYEGIVSVGEAQNFNVWTPASEKINAATNATPLVTVVGTVSYHTPYSPVPWMSSFYIEPGGDEHSMVLNTQSCHYYEGYDTSYGGGRLHEYNGALWSLTQPFSRPPTNPGSTASGIPIGLLSVRPEELTAGVIQHALGWDAVANTAADGVCVSPAAATGCSDGIPYDGPAADAPYAIPYGAHIRLKASVNTSGWPREAQIVAAALKTYGAYLYDTGCCNNIPFINDSYGAPTWTSDDEAAFSTVTIQDFDVVQAP